jgi:hypothetical protein
VNPSWLHSAIPGHLDSAPYRSDSPSHASAGPMPGGESYLSPVPQAPSWDQVPTPAVAAAADANLRNPRVLDNLAVRRNEPSANERVASSFADLVDPFTAAATRTRQSVWPEGGRLEGKTTRLLERAGPDILTQLATLPQRAFGASERMRLSGEYDPAPVIEAATLAVGAPMTPAGALGSAARPLGRPARLPMDETSRMERADAMGFRRNMPIEYGLAPEGEKIVAAAVNVNGRIFIGRNHSEAITRAERELGMPFERMTQAPIVDGFVTDAGRYVSRWEADDIARRASQGEATGDFGATHGLGSETVEMAAPGAVPRSSVRTGATAPGLPGGNGTWGWGYRLPNGASPAEGAPWDRAQRPGTLDARGRADFEIQKATRSAWEAGHDAVLLKNYTSAGGRSGNVLVVRDRAQLRDPKARFDPTKRDSANLLASGAGAAVVGPPLADILGER